MRWPRSTSASRSLKTWQSSWSSSCARCEERLATFHRPRRTNDVSRVSVRPAKESWKRLRMTIASSGVAEVVLDRPPANAIDLVTLAEINEVAETLSLNESVRVVMLRSALDPIFAAGFDLEMLDQNWDQMLVLIRGFHRAANSWLRIPAPTIAVINGHALGGGCELALAC